MQINGAAPPGGFWQPLPIRDGECPGEKQGPVSQAPDLDLRLALLTQEVSVHHLRITSVRVCMKDPRAHRSLIETKLGQ